MAARAARMLLALTFTRPRVERDTADGSATAASAVEEDVAALTGFASCAGRDGVALLAAAAGLLAAATGLPVDAGGPLAAAAAREALGAGARPPGRWLEWAPLVLLANAAPPAR